MLAHQFLLAFWFYLIFSLFAGCGFLLTLRLFPERKLIAYFTAKPLGLAIFGYLIWFLSSLKILNYQNQFFIGVLFILVSLYGFVYAAKFIYKTTNSAEKKQLLKNLFWLELLSLALFFGYLYLRSFNASAFGTERFMDMALLNSSLKAQNFPFVDPWYAGKLVNYYYYGHYLVSLLTRLSGIASFLTYNFTLGLWYSVSILLSGLLVFEISKSKFFAALAGFLITTAGSLFYSACVIDSWLNSQSICSYASSTRFYSPSYIINEIPSYSFTVGDMHAHFLALPFFILNLILIYCLFNASRPTKVLGLSLLVGLVTSALVNPSDVTTLALVLAMLWLFKVYGYFKESGSLKSLVKNLDVRPWFYLAIFLAVGLLLLYLPFLIHFVSPVLGFGFVYIFATSHNFWLNNSQVPTPFLALLGQWGAFIITIAVVIFFMRKKLQQISFAVLLFLASIFLIVFVEVFYIKDIYHIANPAYFRANTVFKYGYHTWTMLSLAFCLSFAEVFKHLALSNRLKKLSPILKWLLAIFIFFSLIYPYQAIEQFYLTNATEPTLDAAAFMSNESQGDLETVNYINQNIKNRPVVLEAVGDSYTYFARMSVFTGNTTLIGWKTHEWTWRFDGAKAEEIIAKTPGANVETGYGAIAKVAEDAKSIYETDSLDEASELIKSYGVKYIYVGDLERKTYVNLQEQKFYQLGKVIFQSGNSKLFEVN